MPWPSVMPANIYFLGPSAHGSTVSCKSKSKPRRTSHRPWKTAQLRCGCWAAGRLLEVTVHDAGESDTAIYSPSTQTLRSISSWVYLKPCSPWCKWPLQANTMQQTNKQNHQEQENPWCSVLFSVSALRNFSSTSPHTSISDEGEVYSWVPAPSWHV